MDSVPPEDSRPGDLVFVHARKDDKLNNLIVDLDQSPYSHVGFIIRPSVMCSARMHPIAGNDNDVGGVREDTLVELMTRDKRDLVLARTTFTANQTASAIAFASPLVDVRDVVDNSEFSVVKLFAVSVALESVRLSRQRSWMGGRNKRRGRHLLDAAVRTADAWAYDKQTRPSFFCAEFIAAAFGMTFEYKELEPPVIGIPPFPIGSTSVPPDLADSIGRQVGSTASADQIGTLLALLVTTARHDPGFMVETVARAIEIVHQLRDRKPEVVVGEARGKMLPTGLVTPRMLFERSELFDWFAAVRKPSGSART